MSRKKANVKFDDYVNMVRSRAWFYSRKYEMEYSDVEAQGFLIYCISLQDYKSKKASFSTFLFRNLNGRLRDYCRQIKNKTCRDMHLCDCYIPENKVHDNLNEDVDFDIFKARETITEEEFLFYAKCFLTPIAYNILKWVLEDQLLEVRSKSNPSLVTISKMLRIEIEELKKVWNELIEFWNYRGAAFYSCI